MPGSHGSLTKAGKVRKQTPKVESREKHSPSPRMRYRKLHWKRIMLGQASGQPEATSRRRR
ncbi:MAG: 30S ribosomal protein S30e [Candidatus Wukongarchaeota archaeon]|nr:30S ribosomal protein S30e [Candidatus Wukongarchaeota archaeon]